MAGLATLGLAFAPALAKAQALSGGPSVVSLGGADKPFTLGVQAITTYDSNPARSDSALGAQRGISGSDVQFSPSITVGYSHTVGQQGVALTGVFGYDYYAKNHVLNSEHIDFSVAGNKTIGAHCAVGGTGAYDRGQSSLQDVSVIVTKNIAQTFSVNVGETCASAAGITERIQVTESSTHNSDSNLVDFNTTGVSAFLGYAHDAVGLIGIVANYDRTSYADVPSAALISPETLEVTSVGLQIDRPIGARLSGSANVLYSHSDQRLRAGAPATGDTSFSGLTGALGLTYLMGPRLQLSANLSRDISASILEDVGYTIANRAELAANYTVSSRIAARLGGSWARNSYRGEVIVVPQATPDWQNLTTVFGSVSMRIGRRSAIGLDVRHEEGRSDSFLYDYTANLVSLTLSTSL